ncbi:class I SAM-dependent methyltransferase [Algoriphagus namhaensis]|uniref:Class I SAM-dependent methyltransferase n=1 Tax=Algoriphagus namhaensis TaxID=915353 RepID=A0ABV8AS49_9BACT
MRQILCPVCSQKPSGSPQENSLVTCTLCETTWTFFSQEVDADALYEDAVYAVVDNRKSIFERIIFREARRVLKKAEKLLKSTSPSLLDFGSGKGQFLWVAKQRSWVGLGIETAADRANFARDKYGVKVLSEFYDKGKVMGAPFDLISLNHVLEHLPDPLHLLKELLNENLAENGMVYLEVPRKNSWQAGIAGKNWMHWDIPKHLTHWTEPILLNGLAEIGFHKVASRKFSIHLGLLGMLQALLALGGYKGNLILALKGKKNPFLLVMVICLTPLALLLELGACLFNRGGILGIYLQANDQN